MKKKLLVAVLILALSMVGCRQEDAKPNEKSDKAEEVLVSATTEITIVTDEINEAENQSDTKENADAVEWDKELEKVNDKSDFLKGFDQYLTPDSSAEVLAAFIDQYGHEATPKEAEYIVENLMLYQTDYIDRSQGLLTLPAYLEALNAMDWQISKEKINEIEDEEVRTFFHHLNDSFLTLSRDEKNPVVQVDWHKLSISPLSFSEDLRFLVDARSQVELIDYQNYYKLAEKIAELETYILQTPSRFVKNQLLKLYDQWCSYLVIGPEGSHANHYITKDGALYEEMSNFVTAYPRSAFGEMMAILLAKGFDNSIDISTFYYDYIRSTPMRQHRWIYELREVGDDVIHQLVYANARQDERIEKVNVLIDNHVKTLIGTVEHPSPYKVDCIQFYLSEDVTTLFFSMNYNKSETERAFIEDRLTIDLNTGEEITLMSYLNLPEEEMLYVINNLSGSDFTSLPIFEMSESGLILKAQREEISSSLYASIPYKKLLPYIKGPTFETLSLEEIEDTGFDSFQREKIELLVSDLTTLDYIDMMKKRISKLPSDQAEEMIELLMLFQSESITQLNKQLDDSGMIPPVKEYFLRIRNDEDISYLEMDWSQVAELDALFSDEFRTLIERNRQQDFFYRDDYYDLAKETVRLEVQEDRVTSPFVKEQMEVAYDQLAESLLIGEVGNHYEDYVIKSGPLYEEMLAFSQAYPESALGKFLIDIANREPLSYKEVSLMIDAFILSENLGPRKWSVHETSTSHGRVLQLAYLEIGNTELSEKMNRTLSKLVDESIEYVLSEDALTSEPYQVSMSHYYRGPAYVTISLSVDYRNKDNQKTFYHRGVSIDLETAELLELDKYLGSSKEEAIKIVNALTGEHFERLPSMQITESGIFLKAHDYEPSLSKYASISRRALIPYIGL